VTSAEKSPPWQHAAGAPAMARRRQYRATLDERRFIWAPLTEGILAVRDDRGDRSSYGHSVGFGSSPL
jgi:hypothetical protein